MIKSLTISGFRGVSGEISLQLGAITLLAGRNGLGKTTVFDAIDWCLFGPSWRLGFDSTSTTNIYHPNLSPIVRMEVALPGRTLQIERRAESLSLDGSRISDRGLIETLMTDPGSIAPYARDIERRLRRVVYLSQEDIRALVHPDSAPERAALFQALLGVPNASVVQSGIRRTKEHLRQREQELRLGLGQLRARKNELELELTDSPASTFDSERIVVEAKAALDVPGPLSVDDLTSRCRRELDRLSAEAVRLDDAVAAIATFRDRRQTDSRSAKQVSRQIQDLGPAEALAVSDHKAAAERLVAAKRIEEEQQARLHHALDTQVSLNAQLAIQRKLQELSTARDEAGKGLAASTAARDLLRRDVDRLHRESELALQRRRGIVTRLTDIESAIGRQHALRGHEGERTGLVAQIKTLSDRIDVSRPEIVAIQARLDGLRTNLANRQIEHDRILKTASRSETLEALLRQAISELPPDLDGCPLCGTVFGSPAALRQHVATAREQFALTSKALTDVMSGLREQEKAVALAEAALVTATEVLTAAEREKAVADERLVHVQELIGSLALDFEPSVVGQFEILSAELNSLDEQLRVLKNELDDASARMGLAEDEVSRGTARVAVLDQQLSAAPLDTLSDVPVSELETQLASQSEVVSAATTAARAGSAAKKEAEEAVKKAEDALRSVTQRVSQLQSELIRLREQEAAETTSLVTRLAADDRKLGSADDAEAWVLQRRASAAERLLLIKRLWSELLIAGTEQRSKTIREQNEAIDREIAKEQRRLDELLRATSRFAIIADSLEATAQSEAAEALQHQRDAIQECFSAIYPFEHLNEVVVGGESVGDVFVTDGRLRSPVQPTMYLSTGQANVLALSMFLGMALRQRLLRIGVMCMDEPVQHMDDLHFLGFVALLKRAGLSRQVLLSTADSNVAEIITRQMNSSWAERPTDFVRYDWHSFTPESGPQVVVRTTASQAVA